MYTCIPYDVYPLIYDFLSPDDMSTLKCVSKEQYHTATAFLRHKYECVLCHEWATATPLGTFQDLDDCLHIDDIMERNQFMTGLSNTKQHTFLCTSCSSIIWTNHTINNLIQCIPSSIRIRYVYTNVPWAYLYYWKKSSMLWAPICIEF